jgi:hypothetical protein
MAETKSKKSAPKVFDVGKPSKAAPSSTAKPIIVSNRPVLQDPMVVKGDSSVSVSADAAALESPSEIRRKIQIKPLHDLADITDEVAPGAPEVSKEASKASGKSKSKKIDVNKDSSDAIDLDLPVEVTGKKAAKADEPAGETTDDKPDEKSDEKSDAPAAKTTESKDAEAHENDKENEKIAEASEDEAKTDPELEVTPKLDTELPADGEPTEATDE